MRSCPQKFLYQYVENAPRDFVPSALLFGSAFHAAAEFMFRCQMEGVEASVGDLVAAYSASYAEQVSSSDLPVKFNKNEDGASLLVLAHRMLEALLASPAAHPAGQILGVEEELRVVLDPALPEVLTRIDLVWQDKKALHVVDLKTAWGKWNEQKASESADQLLLYRQSVSAMARDLQVPVELGFLVVTKQVRPQVQYLPVQAGTEALATLTSTLRQVWQAIQDRHFYPNPSPLNCTICPYKSHCPAFGGAASCTRTDG